MQDEHELYTELETLFADLEPVSQLEPNPVVAIAYNPECKACIPLLTADIASRQGSDGLAPRLSFGKRNITTCITADRIHHLAKPRPLFHLGIPAEPP